MSAAVTISMPVWNTPIELLRRAIDAVLAQTFTDWRLVIVGDGDGVGWPSAATRDPRVSIFHLPERRGRYFADAVVFEATDSPWFTVHDSDDAARPHWLATMLDRAESRSADVVLTGQTVHRFGGTVVEERVQPWGRGSRTLTHHAHMAGLWRRGWLAEVGGPHPAFRVGFDTLLTSLPFLAGRVVALDESLYDRFKRVQSLTTSPETGMRSSLRAQARADLIAMYDRVLADWHAGGSSDELRYLIRDVLTEYPSHAAYAELRGQVEREAKRLRDVIGD